MIKDVAADTSMVGTLARPTTRKAPDADVFWAYGIPTDNLPDPVARSMEGLLEHIHKLTKRIEELEGGAGNLDAPASDDVSDEQPEDQAPKV